MPALLENLQTESITMPTHQNFFEMVEAIEVKMEDPCCRDYGLITYTGEPMLTNLELGWIINLPRSQRDSTHQFSVSLSQLKIDREDPRWFDAYNKLKFFMGIHAHRM